MARADLRLGVLSYNAFIFPEIYKSQVTATPIYSEDNRTVKWVEHQIAISCVITSEDISNGGGPVGLASDTIISQLRTTLTVPRQALSFKNHGYGADLEVGGNSAVRDVDYGPRPRILAMEAVGGRAVNLTWAVTTALPLCSPTSDSLIQFTYTTSIDIEDGMAVRRIGGTYEIYPQNALGTNQAGYSADVLWDRVYAALPQCPSNFRRTHNRELSLDGKRMSFSVVDEEAPTDNPYPEHAVKISVRHRCSTDIIQSGANQWINAVAGNIQVLPTLVKPRFYGWLALLKVLGFRTDPSAPVMEKKDSQSGTEISRSVTRIPLSIMIEEDIYTRNIRFEFSWLLTCHLAEIFKANGMFQPVTPNTWDQWQASIASVNLSPRAFAGLRAPGTGIIVDVCNPLAQPEQSQSTQGNSTQEPETEDLYKPEPEDSWVDYQNQFQVHEQPNTTQYRKLKKTNKPQSNQPTPNSEQRAKDVGFNIPGYLQPGAVEHTTQIRGPSSFKVRMSGYAVRVGYDVPIPSMTTFGGQNVVLASSRSSTKLVGSGKNMNVHLGMWDIWYTVDGQPGGSNLVTNSTHSGLSEYYT